jgi:hypothetical protein
MVAKPSRQAPIMSDEDAKTPVSPGPSTKAEIRRGEAQSGDLIARGLVFGVGLGLHSRQVRSHVGAQRMDFGLQLGLGRHIGANAAKQLENEVFGFVGHQPFMARPSDRGKTRRADASRANFSKDFQAFPSFFQTFPSFFQGFPRISKLFPRIFLGGFE